VKGHTDDLTESNGQRPYLLRRCCETNHQ